jgi:Mn2+/Fe2+ NRAMP family transporter
MAKVGIRAWQLFRLVITLIALACVVQFYLAGRGVFGIRGSADLGDQSSFDAHRMLGYTIAGAALVAVVLAVVLWDKRLILAHKAWRHRGVAEAAA